MALLFPDVGERQALGELLANGEDWVLRLYQNDKTPAETDTLVDYTEANFTDYAAQTLTRSVSGSTWATPTTDGSNNTTSQYGGGTPLTWLCGAVGNTVYGYYIEGAVSGVLIYAERFPAPRILNSGDRLNLTPQLGLN